MQKHIFVFAIVFACTQFNLQSQVLSDSSVIKLNHLVEDFKTKFKIPGISVSIVHGNETAYSNSLGYTDMESKTPVTIDSRFPIMSITKTFTATMLMQLLEKGIVKLDDAVTKYVPEYKVQLAFGGISSTTLFQLATHSAGLPRNSPSDVDFTVSLDKWLLSGGKYSIKWLSSNKELLKSLEYVKLEYPPFHYVHHNDRHYSNLGYSILGIALERAAKVEYSKYIVTNICKPLQMMNSGFLNQYNGKTPLAIGYRYNVITSTSDKLPPFEPHSALYAGGMFSTAGDLAKYISFQFEDDQSIASKVLSADNKAMMRFLKLGWKPAFPFVLHEGSIPGYRSIIVFHPELKVGWAILTNSMDVDFNQINGSIAEIVTMTFKKSTSDLKNYVGTYKLPGGYGSLKMYLKNDSLYSTYLEDFLVGKPLVREGDYRFKVEGKNGYNISYEFVADEDSKITALKMGQFVWYKE